MFCGIVRGIPPEYGVEPQEMNNLKHSESIAQLAAALAKAQGQMEAAPKGRVGQIGRSAVKYADLAAVMSVMRKPFSDNGLSYAQGIATSGSTVTVMTLIMHESGEYLETELSAEAEPATGYVSALQQMGRAITYLRRYSLQSIAGIAAENDDDAALTERDGERSNRRSPAESPEPVPHELAGPLRSLPPEGRARVKAALGLPDDVTLSRILVTFDALDDEGRHDIQSLIMKLTPKVGEQPSVEDHDEGEQQSVEGDEGDDFNSYSAEG